VQVLCGGGITVRGWHLACCEEASLSGTSPAVITVWHLACCDGGGFAATSTDRAGIIPAEMPEAAMT